MPVRSDSSLAAKRTPIRSALPQSRGLHSVSSARRLWIARKRPGAKSTHRSSWQPEQRSGFCSPAARSKFGVSTPRQYHYCSFYQLTSSFPVETAHFPCGPSSARFQLPTPKLHLLTCPPGSPGFPWIDAEWRKEQATSRGSKTYLCEACGACPMDSAIRMTVGIVCKALKVKSNKW